MVTKEEGGRARYEVEKIKEARCLCLATKNAPPISCLGQEVGVAKLGKVAKEKPDQGDGQGVSRWPIKQLASFLLARECLSLPPLLLWLLVRPSNPSPH